MRILFDYLKINSRISHKIKQWESKYSFHKYENDLFHCMIQYYHIVIIGRGKILPKFKSYTIHK